MSQTVTCSLLAACSVAGLILSIYLTFLSFQAAAACNVTEIFSCDAVLNSQYSKIMGVPVAALGVAWFLVASTLSLASFIRPIRPRYFLSWSAVGLLGIPPLIYGEVLVGAICLLCTTAHILGVAIFALSVTYRRTYSADEKKR